MQKVRVALAIAALLLLGSVALATDQGGQSASDALSPAPFVAPDQVQPTLHDLPPAVARTEGKRTKGQENFDRQLSICRGC